MSNREYMTMQAYVGAALIVSGCCILGGYAVGLLAVGTLLCVDAFLWYARQ